MFIPFLASLSTQLYTQYGQQLGEYTIVLPNKRSGLYFQKYLTSILKKPIWMPQIWDIQQFVQTYSKLTISSSLLLVSQLYTILQQLHLTKESFDRFYPWGCLLLKDFDEIDRYLVNPTHLLKNLYQTKIDEQTLSHLNKAQKQAIQSFWKTFDQRYSIDQQHFLNFWTLLPKVYELFRTKLLAQKCAYAGLCYRITHSILYNNELQSLPKLIFIGFNALTPAEEGIFRWLKTNNYAHFYWDMDAYYIHNTQQEAGLYGRQYMQDPVFQSTFQQPLPEYLTSKSKKVTIAGLPSDIGQVQAVGQQLAALSEKALSKTVVVLPDEALLVPMLHALPATISQVNVTMGYPIKETKLYQLIQQLLLLQLSCSNSYFPSEQVISILEHPYLICYNTNLSQEITQEIYLHHNLQVHVQNLISKNDLYKVLFQQHKKNGDALTYILTVLSAIYEHIQPCIKNVLQYEEQALHYYYEQCQQLQSTIEKLKLTFSCCIKLLQQYMQHIKMPFSATSHDGLQIMGVLETRNLDFEHIFILSMNEGIFPSQVGSQHSFIPYSLRKGYGLSLADHHQASVYAYHFYRLLQRAKTIYMTYHTDTASKGEQSRYLWQLLYEMSWNITKKLMCNPLHLHTPASIIIEKNTSILTKMRKFLVKHDKINKTLSPTAINTYLDCSLQFYFKYILELNIPTSLPSSISSALFGKIFHKTAELMYKYVLEKNKIIDNNVIQHIQKQLKTTVRHVWDTVLPHRNMQHGEYIITEQVIIQLATQLLIIDQQYAPFEIVELEMGKNPPSQIAFAIDHQKIVGLSGIMDRVDLKDGVIRVLDYKTGVYQHRFENIASLFDHHHQKRNKAVFQILFYTWLYQKKKPTISNTIMPGIVNIKSPFNHKSTSNIYIKKINSNKYVPITNIAIYQDVWEVHLKAILSNIFDKNIPFTQTKNQQHCTICPYNTICQRHT